MTSKVAFWSEIGISQSSKFFIHVGFMHIHPTMHTTITILKRHHIKLCHYYHYSIDIIKCELFVAFNINCIHWTLAMSCLPHFLIEKKRHEDDSQNGRLFVDYCFCDIREYITIVSRTHTYKTPHKHIKQNSLAIIATTAVHCKQNESFPFTICCQMNHNPR